MIVIRDGGARAIITQQILWVLAAAHCSTTDTAAGAVPQHDAQRALIMHHRIRPPRSKTPRHDARTIHHDDDNSSSPNCPTCAAAATAFAPATIGVPCAVTSASQSSWNNWKKSSPIGPGLPFGEAVLKNFGGVTAARPCRRTKQQNKMFESCCGVPRQRQTAAEACSGCTLLRQRAPCAHARLEPHKPPHNAHEQRVPQRRQRQVAGPRRGAVVHDVGAYQDVRPALAAPVEEQAGLPGGGLHGPQDVGRQIRERTRPAVLKRVRELSRSGGRRSGIGGTRRAQRHSASSRFAPQQHQHPNKVTLAQ